MKLAVFYVTLGAELLSAIAVAVSVVLPQRRIWPPSQRHAWTGHLMWFLFIASGVGMVALGIADWGGSELPPWVRWGMGLPLWIGGCALAQWAASTMGVARTLGDSGGLVREGPYRFSRNPQYVGFMLSLVGWALVAGSAKTMVAALVGLIPLLLVPFAEEPWLAAAYGAEYEEYRRSVPRFIL